MTRSRIIDFIFNDWRCLLRIKGVAELGYDLGKERSPKKSTY
ncbi:hypothetical protein [Okeania sp. KiyG1]|nr:hypothetical protein [Okeania sp. KiyG1]